MRTTIGKEDVLKKHQQGVGVLKVLVLFVGRRVNRNDHLVIVYPTE